MKKIIINLATFSLISLSLSACNNLFEQDNTPAPSPLTKFTPETHIKEMWYSSSNFGVGSGPDYIRLIPAVDDRMIVTAAKDGAITATNRLNGNRLWRTDTQMTLTAGPTIDSGYVFIGSQDGRITALRQSDGSQAWRAQLSSEVLAPAAAKNGYVIVKTLNGDVTALSEHDGHPLWHFQQTEPDLVLRGGSTPQISGRNTVVGFANGNLCKLSLRDGDVQWQQQVAIPEGSFAIQRMVDINSTPLIYDNRVYVATYQGKVAALDLATGRQVWTQDMSSYQGIAVDNSRVYVSDAHGGLWAFDRDSGRVDWKQSALRDRNITGPAVIGNDVVIADRLGYMHVLNKSDGRFIARTRVNRFGILAAPVVKDDTIYIVTKDGHLAAYTLG